MLHKARDVIAVFCSVVQDSGIDDDVVVMTDDYEDLMDDDAVVLPDAHNASVSQCSSTPASYRCCVSSQVTKH